MVLMLHGFEINFGNQWLAFVRNLVLLGNYGVDLFFVLSGFLITGILMDTAEDPHYFKRFFARRALRILPLYYGLLLLLVGLTPLLHFHWNGMAPYLFAYIQNFRPVEINNLALVPGPVGLYHFWTLAIEEQFYLVWPFVVYAVKGRKSPVFKLTVWISVVILVARLLLQHYDLVSWQFLKESTLMRADSLLIGGALAVLYRSERAWPRVLALAPWVLVVIGGVFLASAWFPLPAFWYALQYTVAAVFFAALLAWSLCPTSPAKHVFSVRWLRWLGKYSYGLYVIHAPVLSLLQLPLRLWLRRTLHSGGLAVVLSAVLLYGLSILLAWLSFQFYEKRFLKLKRNFAYEQVKPARVQHASTVA
jgi:peptidoglycan/LPS O-acetylase OafA/YrhL